MGKRRCIIKSKEEVVRWIEMSNLFAKSLILAKDALEDFNKLSAEDRVAIRKELVKYDELRRKKIPVGEADIQWELSVMVDAHIIAADYNTNPLVVIMCLYPLCKSNETLIVC